MRVKRESGENPERCSHCVREFFLKPLGNREGRKTMNEVRRPACHVDDLICCLRIGFPAIMYTGRIPLYPVVYMNNVVENCRSNAAVLYCNNITKKEEES